MKKYALLFIMGGLLSSPVGKIKAEELDVGKWKGYLINELDNRYAIVFKISYIEEEDANLLNIKMINLDLEPIPEFTYSLIDIVLNDETLSFKVPREYDTRSCILTKQADGSFTGRCQSDKAIDGEFSHLSITPPTEKLY